MPHLRKVLGDRVDDGEGVLLDGGGVRLPLARAAAGRLHKVAGRARGDAGERDKQRRKLLGRAARHREEDEGGGGRLEPHLEQRQLLAAARAPPLDDLN